MMKSTTLFFVIKVAILALFLNTAQANPELDQLSSGAHSYRELGADFSVDLPMKSVASESRLLLFNFEAAKRAGIPIPEDHKLLEKEILKRFAVVVDPNGESKLKMIATRYQDSTDESEGGAKGDGRGVVAGELTREKPDGTHETMDAFLKGVGQTPLAWINHQDPSHKDGLQSREEAIHSFIMSQANQDNQLDTTIDLAVIEIPLVKKHQRNGKQEKATITLRIGNQMRPAHFRYFRNEPENFRKTFEYNVRRELGLHQDHKITQRDVNQYLKKFTENLADESARYTDLHAVHGSITPGNRTTSGSTIDMGTFRYLDSHHSKYTYLKDKFKVEQQAGQMKDYIKSVFSYMKAANYPFAPKATEQADYLKKYDQNYQNFLTRHWLNRLGLNSSEVEKAMTNKIVAGSFFRIVKKMQDQVSSKVVEVDRKPIKPAMFDFRKAFASTMKVLLKYQNKPNTNEDVILDEIFKSDATWFQGYNKRLAKDYIQTIKQIVNVSFNRRIDPKWQLRASKVNGKTRIDRNQLFEKYEGPIDQMIEQGNASFVELSDLAAKAADAYVDPGLLPREKTNATASPNVKLIALPNIQHENKIAVPCEAKEPVEFQQEEKEIDSTLKTVKEITDQSQ